MTRERLLALLGAALLRGLFATLRLRFDDRFGLLTEATPKSSLFCFWHNRILGITFAFDRLYPKNRLGVTVLTSPSRDGEILAQLVAAFGMGSVRGSSSRRGSRALLELVRLIRLGRDIAITPDGPRGPCYDFKPGAVIVARRTRAPMILVGAEFTSSWRLRSWDRFHLPRPFSRVRMRCEIIEPEQLADRVAGMELVRSRLLALNPDR